MDAAIAYTKDRKQFGQSISSFRGVQFMLADMAMKVEALPSRATPSRAVRGVAGYAVGIRRSEIELMQ